MAKKNLILIPDLKHHDRQDFNIISQHILMSCKDVVPFVVRRRWLKYVQYYLALKPTLYVGLMTINWEPIRGKFLRDINYSKSQQYCRMENANIPVLNWCVLSKVTALNFTGGGDYVIVKPDLGRKGIDVRLIKVNNLNFNPFKKELIQRFVYTGTPAVSFGVCTLFGSYLYCVKRTGVKDENSTIAVTPQGGSETLFFDSEIITLAEKVAKITFPEIPVLGIDIIRCIDTGEIFCLEVNPFGKTWHFSSAGGKKIFKKEGFHYKDQTNAFEKAAKILIDKARELAQ